MSVAAGFRFVTGSFEFIRDDNTLINTDISGTGSGFNAGVQFSPVDNITLGFTYKSEVSLSLDGNTSEVPGSPGSGLRQPSPVNTELKLPQSFAVGINWITETQVVLEFNAIWFGWSSIDRLDLSPASSSYTNNIIDFQFEDKIQYRIGLEYNAANILTFRTGILISSSPVKDSAVHPAFPDTDAEAASLGVGWTNSDGNLTTDRNLAPRLRTLARLSRVRGDHRHHHRPLGSGSVADPGKSGPDHGGAALRQSHRTAPAAAPATGQYRLHHQESHGVTLR